MPAAFFDRKNYGKPRGWVGQGQVGVTIGAVWKTRCEIWWKKQVCQIVYKNLWKTLDKNGVV
jgi:hypothetical protein